MKVIFENSNKIQPFSIMCDTCGSVLEVEKRDIRVLIKPGNPLLVFAKDKESVGVTCPVCQCWIEVHLNMEMENQIKGKQHRLEDNMY